MKSSSKFWLLSTGILLSLLVTSHPLAVKADENSAVTPPSQTEAVTNPTVNSSLAASDSTTEGNTESSQAETQTKEANSLTSQASTTLSASLVHSSSTSSAQAYQSVRNKLSYIRSDCKFFEPVVQSEKPGPTSKAPSFPFDSSKANVTNFQGYRARAAKTIIISLSTMVQMPTSQWSKPCNKASLSACDRFRSPDDITGPATLDGIKYTIKANDLVPINY
ncbi:hypothetical protein KF146HA_01793 [Lactococcus lactis]|nr:hypothetical protein [Lactococcus lactis]